MIHGDTSGSVMKPVSRNENVQKSSHLEVIKALPLSECVRSPLKVYIKLDMFCCI